MKWITEAYEQILRTNWGVRVHLRGDCGLSTLSFYAWIAASLTSIHLQCFLTMHLGKHNHLAENKWLHIFDIIQDMFHYCHGESRTDIKIQLAVADWQYRGKREVSGLTLDLSLSVFVLRCHNSVRDVICSASYLIQVPQDLFFFCSWKESSCENNNLWKMWNSWRLNQQPLDLHKLLRGGPLLGVDTFCRIINQRLWVY